MPIKIGLDAGHGLKTPGKQTPNGIKEWTLNDKVRDKVAAILSDYDVEIINTDNDEGNTDESLAYRIDKYMTAGVKLFVSIHHNAFNGQWNTATGVEVFVDRNNTAEDMKLAEAIYSRLPKYTGLRGRGIRKENWWVINQNKIPAVLVEGGFMDSNIDYKVITSDAGQTGYAKAVAEGIIEYLGLKKKVSTTTSSSVKTYTVQKGDTLSEIGQKVGIDWKTIATLNGIKSPYNIKVGQVLKLSNPTTPKKYISNNIDYSPVFNPSYYSKKYADLKKAFGTDSEKLFTHFLNYGMKEGRVAKSTFNVTVYKNRYADLRKAFGNDLPAYYKHYIQFGKKEGRSAV